MSRIGNMRESMLEAGFYSSEDIEEICQLESDYDHECERIAEECEEEGYPAHGSNYELRCEEARKWYDEQIGCIEAKYGLEEGYGEQETEGYGYGGEGYGGYEEEEDYER